jgi:hypothetical protein
MSFAASLAISWAGRGAARRFDQSTHDPMGAQRRKLTEILARNRDTEYGLEHGFAAVRNHQHYAKAVPVVSYNDIEARVTRMTDGEKNILTAEDPVMFARTSGTTGISSEARGSIPLSDDGCGGVLTVATNVYEFAEITEVDKDPDQWQRWAMRAVDELEVGKEYYIFITTTGGLYRYDMKEEREFLLAVVGKEKA